MRHDHRVGTDLRGDRDDIVGLTLQAVFLSVELAPCPRRSTAKQVKSLSSSETTPAQLEPDCKLPCTNTSDGPVPDTVTLSRTPSGAAT